jgi:hypothetical protein
MWPRWSRGGDRLFYAKDDDIMAVDVTLGTTPTLGSPQRVIQRPRLSVPTVVSWAAGFDVSEDGERFLFFRDPPTGVADRQVVVVQNWYSEFAVSK